MYAKERITNSWTKLLQDLKVHPEPHTTCILPTGKEAERLGQAFWEYFTAAIYDCNWEGFSSRECQGVAALLQDLGLCVQHDLVNVPKGGEDGQS